MPPRGQAEERAEEEAAKRRAAQEERDQVPGGARDARGGVLPRPLLRSEKQCAAP